VTSAQGSVEILKLLREWGANPYHANNNGKTPIATARLIANPGIADVFADLPPE